MSDWPKNNETARFSDLTGPVVNLVRQAYSLKLNAPTFTHGLKWRGPSLPESMGATCLEFSDAVSAEQLRHDTADQGRDPLEVIVGIAVQLGIEQGRRLGLERKIKSSYRERLTEILKETLEREKVSQAEPS